jgi:hypothetical protein
LIGLLFAETQHQAPPKELLEKASGFPAKPERPKDGHLAGLLTYASTISSAFPDSPVACARISAITVARQWRILTALPNARRETVIDEDGRAVKSEIAEHSAISNQHSARVHFVR